MNLEVIESQIQKGGEIAPFLFLSQNLELLHSNLANYISDLVKKNNIDQQSIFRLSDDGESIKIAEIKNFITQADIKPRFAFQVFIIENISRFTLQSANACLKFFEEPGEGNIVILTNTSESGILETILSRVQIISGKSSQFSPEALMQFSPNVRNEASKFYLSMIESHISGTSSELVRYFFTGKYEKQEYVDFLYALVEYIAKTGDYTNLLDEIQEDVSGILKNNLQGKYVVDKYVVGLGD